MPGPRAQSSTSPTVAVDWQCREVEECGQEEQSNSLSGWLCARTPNVSGVAIVGMKCAFEVRATRVGRSD